MSEFNMKPPAWAVGEVPPVQVAQSFAPYAPKEGVKAQEIAPTKWSTRLDGGCPACVAKHLAQAILLLEEVGKLEMRSGTVLVMALRAVILDHESRNGYPGHKWLAAGMLANAEMEALSTGLSGRIREIRLDYVASGASPLADSVYDLIKVSVSQRREAMALAHIWEAIAELPVTDAENREALRRVGCLLSDDPVVPEVSRILKAVVETYALEPTDG